MRQRRWVIVGGAFGLLIGLGVCGLLTVLRLVAPDRISQDSYLIELFFAVLGTALLTFVGGIVGLYVGKEP